MILIFFLVFLFANIANASYECSLVHQLYDQLHCYDGGAWGPGGTMNQQIPDPNFVLNSDFGPSLCKAKQVLDEVRKNLKTECDVWLKERKSDLGKSYMTGTCQETQAPCAGGLVQLTFKGLVHYAKPAVTKTSNE